MLLKKASKASKAGFKRKKLAPLGTLKEIKDGTKSLKSGVAGFSLNPALKFSI
jgi:hypothetical protein